LHALQLAGDDNLVTNDPAVLFEAIIAAARAVVDVIDEYSTVSTHGQYYQVEFAKYYNLHPMRLQALLIALTNPYSSVRCLRFYRSKFTPELLKILSTALPHISGALSTLPLTKCNSRIVELAIQSCDLTSTQYAFRTLIQGIGASSLTTVRLDGNHIGDLGVSDLATLAIVQCSTLSTLSLCGTDISNVGVKYLCDAIISTRDCNLTELDLGDNINITGSALRDLARALPECKLTSLNLDNTCIQGALGFAEFAQALPFSSLERLSLCAAEIDAADIQPLITALPASSIISLDLGSTCIGDEGVLAIAAVLTECDTLEKLNLGPCGAASSESIQAIADTLSQSSLTSLDLSYNDFGAAGGIAISSVLSQSGITELDLSGTVLSCAGATALAQVIPESKLRVLLIDYNCIGEDGGAAVLTALVSSTSSITSLHMSHNRIGSNAAALVLSLDLFQQCRALTSLNLADNGIVDLTIGEEITKAAKAANCECAWE
jgi:Ran GTPase-activating protein (RanGAP) involved in mRNA processing and transport